jgi:hypothetical protein
MADRGAEPRAVDTGDVKVAARFSKFEHSSGGMLVVYQEENMASIHREIVLEVGVDQVWSAVRDVGAIHTRLAPGFVTNVKLEAGARIVTFGNGMTARELIVDLNDETRRLAWSVVGGQMTHHNASAQVFADGPNRTRFVWIADLLPHELGPAVAGMIEQGLKAMKQHFENPR